MAEYQLHIKIGINEFNAEGTEAKVREDYKMWLAALAVAGKAAEPPPRTDPKDKETPKEEEHRDAPSEKALLRVYKNDKGILSLVRNPSGKGAMKDAILALLFGYSTVLGAENVKSSKLLPGLQKSGFKVVRLDRHIKEGDTDFTSGGAKSGRVYGLTNPGLKRGREVFKELSG